MVKHGRRFKLRTSLKFPILLEDRLSSERETRPSRPMPIVSILLLAKFNYSNLCRDCKLSIFSILFSSIHNFSKLIHFSMFLILFILFLLK
jgi:Ca2+-dependent lipid-binding protein